MAVGFRVGIVGATGAVGQELLKILAERNFPVIELRLLASARSVGKAFEFGGQRISVEEALPTSFDGLDFAFFSAGATRSRALAPAAIEAGAIVIDNSSAFRMDAGTPLVVPEVNASAVDPASRLVAVPNCTAILLLTVLSPLQSLGDIDRVIVSTYQSASGGGAAMMERLLDETRRSVVEGGAAIRDEDSPIPPYAFNLFSHNTPVGEDGFNEEETKVVQECRKILGKPQLKLNVTCVRVPVLRAHSESVTVEFAGNAPTEAQVRTVLAAAPGVRLVDDRAANRFPTPIDASGGDDVLVGRIRKDLSHPSAISLFLSGDQLRKGAALNAVQIAELIAGIGTPVGTLA